MLKPYLIIIACLFAFNSNGQSLEEKLIGTWSIDKVENIEKVEFAPEELNQGITYQFRKNKTATFDQDNDFGTRKSEGTWQIQDSIATVNSNSEIDSFRIEKLDDKELIWVMLRGRELRFYYARVD
jgi:hypothetical protein